MNIEAIQAIEILQLTRILATGTIAFFAALFLTPLITHYLYKYRVGKQIRSDAPVFASLHGKKAGTPTMGGIIVWLTVVILAGIFFVLSRTMDGIFTHLDIVNRAETYLPLAALIIAALLGLADDLLGAFKMGRHKDGLSISQKLMMYAVIAGVGAWWFYDKLDWDIRALHVPFFGDFSIGIWYVPLFMFVIVASAFSSNEVDGLDGLAGGVLLIAFVCLGVVSFVLGRYDLAAFIATLSGALVAFLWFNVYPARFFMGDTGSMSLGITLGIIAMLTNTALLLPFFAFILVAESGSVIIQMTSKKLFGRKIFHSTPIHHHFEAVGWPETKVTMRFWILSGIAAGFGLILFFLDRLLVL